MASFLAVQARSCPLGKEKNELERASPLSEGTGVSVHLVTMRTNRISARASACTGLTALLYIGQSDYSIL
jgi:hypothetical protein